MGRPVTGSSHTFTVSLFSQATGAILANPTLAAGDVLVSTDGGALASITTLPSVTPASSGIVEVELSASEVGSEYWSVHFVDVAGSEWKSLVYHDQNDFAAGGDATEANQTSILAALTPVTIVYNAQPDSTTINLVRGDAYDDVSWNKLAWVTSKAIDAATSLNFTVRDATDTVIIDNTTTGVTVTGVGTDLKVELSSAATALLPLGTLTFDVEVTFSSTSKWTPVSGGIMEVSADMSRT